MIEKNIPVPVRRSEGSVYGFSEMEPGDSIFFSGEKSTGRPMTAFRVFCHRNNWKGCSRSVEGGIRIWRVA